jgi:hypothetical protein
MICEKATFICLPAAQHSWLYLDVLSFAGSSSRTVQQVPVLFALFAFVSINFIRALGFFIFFSIH